MTPLKCLMRAAPLILLAACTTAAPSIDEADACGASRLKGFVGQPVAALDDQYLPEVVRIIRPGDAVTEDYSPSRLNVDLDRADRITGFWCG